MTDDTDLKPRDWASHPPYRHAPYKSTALRSPDAIIVPTDSMKEAASTKAKIVPTREVACLRKPDRQPRKRPIDSTMSMRMSRVAMDDVSDEIAMCEVSF